MLMELKAHHREIARLSFEGHTPADIARKMDMNVVTVRGVLKDPLCRAHIDRLSDKADDGTIDVRKRLAEFNKHALDVVENLLRDDTVPAATRLKTAQDVLDRNGYNVRHKHEHAHVHLSAEELADLKERARNAGAIWENEENSDVTYETSSPEDAFQLGEDEPTLDTPSSAGCSEDEHPENVAASGSGE
jgi:hypothetical protein